MMKLLDRSSKRFPIVVLCASSGGLEAFQAFFETLPPNTHAAFIVMQYLFARCESILPRLIQKYSPLPTEAIHQPLELQAGQVYVLPAGYKLRIHENLLKPEPQTQILGWPETIDGFLPSLAAVHQERVALIILSGTGKDLIDAARAVKSEGGLVIAQGPETTNYDEMARSVIDANLSDAILSPEQMPDYLMAHFAHKTLQASEAVTEENPSKLFAGLETLDSLEKAAIRASLKNLDRDTVFRVWVSGGAGGEQAVLLAILIYECLQELEMLEMEVKIFATDLNSALIDQARKSLYPVSIAAEMDESRLKHHFILENSGYRLRKHISRMILWGQHNLIDDPPFSQLHLISCRNLLMNLERPLQEQIFSLFHFALREDGILVLGSADLVNVPPIFRSLRNHARVYQRVSGFNPFAELLLARSQKPVELQKAGQYRGKNQTVELIQQSLIEHYTRACVLLDEAYQPIHTFGDVDLYLRLIPGKPGQHSILELAREGLVFDLSLLLQDAFETNKTRIRRDICFTVQGEEQKINLILKAIPAQHLGSPFKLLIFEPSLEKRNLGERTSEEEKGALVMIQSLRSRLQEMEKLLQKSQQELQAKSEELRGCRKKLQATNEEFEAANEELITSKDELKVMNEALNLLNNQLILQNKELRQANNILYNFFHSTELCIIILDLKFCVREYSPAVTDIFSLRPHDKGCPFEEIHHCLDWEDWIADASSVLDTLKDLQKQVYSTDGRCYELHIRPYRTVYHGIDGLILSFYEKA